MTTILDEFQFDLDGVAFGDGLPVQVADDGFDAGDAERAVQDEPRPQADGVMLGRDYDGAATWAFELMAIGADSAAAMEAYRTLVAAWKNPALRAAPGEQTFLRYCINGRTRRVYGRPRTVTPVVSKFLHQGYLPFGAEFLVSDPLFYDDQPQTTTLTLFSTSDGGVVLPAVLPWVLGRSTVMRQGILDIAGDVSTPFTVVIDGPANGIATKLWVSGPGWRIDVDATVAYDQQITIDTRAMTVLRSDGASLSGKISKTSTLNARLSPGSNELRFGATDPSATTRATFTLHAAYSSL